MTPTVNLLVLSMVVLIKMCTCRYVVPKRPPVEIKSLDNYHPEAEFRDHAIRVGNIIADLLRSEIRLMLKINSTIADGKSHKNHHYHQQSEQHVNSEENTLKETNTPEETNVEAYNFTDKNNLENPHPPVKDLKVSHSHEIEISKHLEKEVASEKTKDCVHPVASASKVPPNILMLEQKIYGASLSGEPLDSSSPIIVQRFIWNPHNVSHMLSANSQQPHGLISPKVLSHSVGSKPPSTSTAISTQSMGKKPSVNLNNQEHNINLDLSQTVNEFKASSTSTSEPPKQTSYNPLAGLAETTEKYIETTDPIGHQEPQVTQQEASVPLPDRPSEAESQGVPPGFELVEAAITEKQPEEVKGEVI